MLKERHLIDNAIGVIGTAQDKPLIIDPVSKAYCGGQRQALTMLLT